MKFGKIFVTVGTTEFNNLIAKVSETEVYEILKNHLGCDELTLQIGNGNEVSFDKFTGVKVTVFGLKDSITDDIESADLVIKS